MNKKLYLEGFTQNRELSWLRFNDRVLSEAADDSVPLIERLKFTSIFSSNLDEFFMVRVGSLYDMYQVKADAVDSRSGMTPEEQLSAIYNQVHKLIPKHEKIFSDVEKLLRQHGIYCLRYAELESPEKKFVKEFYQNNILPILSPQIIDTLHPFAHIPNKQIYIAAQLTHEGKTLIGLIPVPTVLPDVVYLPGAEIRYIRIEDIILHFVESIFSMYKVKESVALCVTRNADISPQDEAFDIEDDFRKKMRKVLSKRKRLAVVRLELSGSISNDLRDSLCDRLAIKPSQIFVTSAPLKLKYVFALEGKLNSAQQSALLYEPFTPQPSPNLNLNRSIMKQVDEGDVLLGYPYESMDGFLQMIKEAADDPEVISIKISIYRMASQTKIVDYLCAAAENGKDVSCLIELRARFDEQNNIHWALKLEEAGCTIIYGFEDFKVHSKVCLITARRGDKVRYYTQIGTGNYNEKTAKQYTDLCLLTANQEIGLDAHEFFKNMAIGNLEGQYNRLIVAPTSLKQTVMKLIDEQIELGRHGQITVKINSFTDVDLLQKLHEASAAGVQIRMIIRGICCLLPGIPKKTENIFITSIVGRFLEHSRVYIFGKDENEKMYISSADFMTRNTDRRVEVGCPILDPNIRSRINSLIDLQLRDNVKARILTSNGTYIKKPASSAHICAQEERMKMAAKAAAERSDELEEAKETKRRRGILGIFRKK